MATPSAGAAGGTLNYLIFAPIEHVDPQRIYVGRDITNFSRTVYRQLVTFPISTDAEVSNTPVPDLATDTGTSSRGRQDLVVHGQGRREVGGRPADHV